MYGQLVIAEQRFTDKKNWDTTIIRQLMMKLYGVSYCKEDEKYDARTFLKFLKEIVQEYPAGNIVMILDNSHVHHAKLIQTFWAATPH